MSTPLSSAAPVAHVVLGLAVLLLCARVAGELSVRVGQPQVLGEVAIGILLGSVPGTSFFAELGREGTFELFGQIGAVLLLFEVGLASNLRDIGAASRAAARVAILGTVATFALGWGVAAWLLPDAPPASKVFVGAAITATSVGISARVLRDLGRARGVEGQTILGAAVLDDVISLVILALVSGRPTEAAGTSAASVALLVAKTVAYLAVVIVVGRWMVQPLLRGVLLFRTKNALVLAGLCQCFLFAWSADVIGLSPIIGAFAAGLVFEDSDWAPFVARGEPTLEVAIEPVSALFVPLFFVLLGIRADVHVFLDPRTLLFAFALTVAAVAGKLACGLGAPRNVNRLAVSMGMMPRGEVTLLFASSALMIGFGGGPAARSIYSSLVVVVVVTTVATPPALQWAFRR